MKVFLLLICLFCLSASSFGQYYHYDRGYLRGNPKGINLESEFRYRPSAPNGWQLILKSGRNGVQTPEYSAIIPLPFPFTFNGRSFNTFRASRNGFIYFTDSDTSQAFNDSDFSNTLPNNSIFLLNGLIADSTAANKGDYFICKTFGTAPNRHFYIQLNSATFQGGLAEVTASFVLEETSNKLYTVMQKVSNAEWQMYSTLKYSGNNTYTAYSANSIWYSGTRRAYYDTQDDNYYVEFTPGIRPQLNASLKSITSNQNYRVGVDSLGIKGLIINDGIDTLKSIDVFARVNNGTTYRKRIKLNNIATSAEGYFEAKGIYLPSDTGYKSLKIWIALPNSGVEIEHSRDTLWDTAYVASQAGRTLILNEMFTSASCGYCNPGNANFEATMNTRRFRDSTLNIKYQINIPGRDVYTTKDNLTRQSYYGAFFAPDLIVHGTGYSTNPASPIEFYRDIFNKNIAWVDADAKFIQDSTKFYIRVELKSYGNMQDTNLRLFAILTEDTTHRNRGTNGETEFYDVARKIFKSTSGIPLPKLRPGERSVIIIRDSLTNLGYERNYASNIENYNRLKVKIFIQRYITKEIIDASLAMKISPSDTITPPIDTTIQPDTLISNVKKYPKWNLNIYPNPAHSYIIVEGLDVNQNLYFSLSDLQGRQLESTEITSSSINENGSLKLFLSKEIASGIYYVTFTQGSLLSREKIVVGNSEMPSPK